MAARDLANYLQDLGVVRTERVIRAFAEVDRQKFVPDHIKMLAGTDEALPIGHGQTISQPYTVAFMLELLAPKRGHKILDVGSGSGWTTALLAHIVRQKGSVYGVERVPELVEFGRKNLGKFDFSWASIQQAHPNILGLLEHRPFDRILVSATADVVPSELLKQLRAPGRLVAPVGNAIVLAIKDKNGNVTQERFEGFVFVPLIRR